MTNATRSLLAAVALLSACGAPAPSSFTVFGSAESSTVANAEAEGVMGVAANDTAFFLANHQGHLYALDATKTDYGALNASPDGGAATGFRGNLLQGAVGTLELGDSRQQGVLIARGDRLYAALAGGNLKTIDVSKPASMRVLSEVGVQPSNVMAALGGKWLWLSNGPAVEQLDVSGDTPVVSVKNTGVGAVTALAATETHLYTVDSTLLNLVVWKVMDGSPPQPLTPTLQAKDASGAAVKMTSLAVRGKRLYVGGAGTLGVFDLSDEEAPKPLGPVAGKFGHSMNYAYGDGRLAMAVLSDSLAVAPGPMPLLWDTAKPEAPAFTQMTGLGTDVEPEHQLFAAATSRAFLVGSNVRVYAFGVK